MNRPTTFGKCIRRGERFKSCKLLPSAILIFADSSSRILRIWSSPIAEFSADIS
jgi:hypothetical protein